DPTPRPPGYHAGPEACHGSQAAGAPESAAEAPGQRRGAAAGGRGPPRLRQGQPLTPALAPSALSHDREPRGLVSLLARPAGGFSRSAGPFTGESGSSPA